MLYARPHLDRICIAYSAVLIFAPASGGFVSRVMQSEHLLQNRMNLLLYAPLLHTYLHTIDFYKNEFSIWVMAVQDDSEVGRGGK